MFFTGCTYTVFNEPIAISTKSDVAKYFDNKKEKVEGSGTHGFVLIFPYGTFYQLNFLKMH
jgi:hypothetical protein